MNTIKVSVIIPVYNTEEYVGDALGSIINQDLKEIEIIVINDGSTDNSLEIVRSISNSDTRIRIYSQKNKGLSVSRNYGMSLAKGEFIYFMDSDDILSSNALLDCYRKCKKDTLDFIFFDARIIGQPNAQPLINYQRTHLLEEKVYDGLDILGRLLEMDIYLSSVCLNFINLEFLKHIELVFYPGIIHEDELFTFLLFLQTNRVSFIPYAYFYRRIRDDSIMTTSFSRKNVIGYFIVARELMEYQKKERNRLSCLLIDKRLNYMFKGILYNTRFMNLKDRTYVLIKCLTCFRKYTMIKDLVLAMIPITHFLKLKKISFFNNVNKLFI